MLPEPPPDEEHAVAEAIDAVVAEFAPGDHEERGWLVAQLLNLKHTYLDRTLYSWSRQQVGELLLEVLPRKVVVERSDLPLIVATLADLLPWLDERGVLRPRGGGAELSSYARSLAGPFAEAMADETRWGMGKRLMGGWADGDLDPTDAEQLQARMDAFNALPFELRDQLLGGALPPVLPPLPPVALAPTNELTRAAEDAALLRRVGMFVEYVGDGRALTDNGNLRLADARELIELLGTGDRMDPQFSDRTYKTTSSMQLTGLDLVFRLTVEAGFARTAKNKVTAAKSRRSTLTDDPLKAWYALFEALVEFGLVQHRRGEDRYGLGWYADVLDEQLPGILAALYAAAEPVAFDELADQAWDVVLDAYDVDPARMDRHREGLAYDLGYALHRLEDAGAVRLRTRQGPHDYWPGETREVIEDATLTDLGTWGVQHMATSHGLHAPVVGALADLPAGDLLAKAPDLPEDEAAAELDLWLARHGAEALVTALPNTGTTARGLVFRALLRLGDEAAAAVEGLRADAALAAYALVWRVDARLASPEEARVDDPAGLVTLLAAALDIWGRQSLPHWLSLVTADTDPSVLLAQAWRVTDADPEPVLVALAATLRDKALAKEARKALFKLRSTRGG